MKRNISHLLYIVAIGFFTSCSDFLDVAPKDKVLEEDQYKTEAGIHGALNGLYRQLISTSLYGCLLYTSPSPRDYAASRMPSSA